MFGFSARARDLSARLLVRSAPVFVTTLMAIVVSGCTTSSAQPESPPATTGPAIPASGAASTPEKARADAQNGIVRIKPESQPYVAVEAVAATQTGSTVSCRHIEFRDGALAGRRTADGRILRVHVMVGQKVHAGDPLLTLDCPDATGSRAAAQVADAALREANLELERQRRMQKEGVGIERDLVAAETKVSAAEAEVKREEAVNASLGSGTAGSVVVRALIDGVVTSRKANVGMSVERGGEPLVEIGDPPHFAWSPTCSSAICQASCLGPAPNSSFATTDHALHGKVSGEGEVVGSGRGPRRYS